MKNSYLILMFILLSTKVARSQYEQWNFQAYAIGANATGGANCPMGAMPDIALINGTYYMYYVAKYGTLNAIWYASSPDMLTWTVEDTIMTASSDPSNRIYDLGGPGILPLDNGDFRLYYRTAQQATFPDEPLFHIRSMISSDGINFTHEGIRVECQPYLPNSYFLSASHPAVYKDQNGDTKAFITGRDSTMNINDPARLYTATSPDEGLTFENFTPMYNGCHDPVVILDSIGTYHMYTSYLGSGHREATSADGITWPVGLDTMYMYQGATLLTEETSPVSIADLGAGVLPNGAIMLYSNYKSAPGAWTNIASFIFGGYAEMEEGKNNSFLVYPNPACTQITILNSAPGMLHIYTMTGQHVRQIELTEFQNEVSLIDLIPGQYVLYFQSGNTNEKTLITLIN